ncbi:MAG: SpoIIE family protein phosphatase [Mariniphaga sp.]|nr:SpoIIE family protein phosphatase [Mariniphaga sp.]
MSKQSTAFRLSLYISIAIVSVLLIVIIIVYRNSFNLINGNIEKSSVSMSSPIITEIRDKVISSEEIAKNTARQLPYFSKNGDVELLVKSLISNYQFIQAIHIDLDENVFPGKIINYSVYRRNNKIEYFESFEKIAICEEEMLHAEPIMTLDSSGWTEPFICEMEGEPVSMFCVPVRVEISGKILSVGYVSVELSLSFLNNLIQNIKVGNNGFSFLISKEGTYLTHPEEEWILSRNIKNLSDSVYRGDRNILIDALESNSSGSFIAYPRLLDYKKSRVYFTHIVENNWMLIFVLPYSEIYSELWILLFKLVLISLAGIIAIFFLVSYISKRLMNPLAQIASEIHEFSSAGRLKISKNEVEILEKSYSLIQAWYNRFKIEQEKSRLSNKQIKTELEQASEIIDNIIPTRMPDFPGKEDLEIYSAFKPANVIGGDFYDYFLIDNNHLLITIGDVSGKGISAAMFVGVAHTLLRSNVSGMISKNIVKELNNELFKKNRNQYFLTLFVGVLDLSTGLLNYCNAAHTTSLIIKSNGDIDELTGTHGLPLGLYANRDYEGSVIKLSANDVLFIYTDGVTETVDTDGGRYGEKRLKKLLMGLKDNSLLEIVNNLEDNLKIFKGAEKQIDDYSMVAIKYMPK